MRTIRDIPVFENTPILVRASLNVPIINGKVVDNYRLRKAVNTIQFLAERKAKIILIGHIGEKGTETLEPVAKALGVLVPHLSFFNKTTGADVRSAVRNLFRGNILMLENLRRDKGEVENNQKFANELASLADFFIEDSFDTCHRMHASIVGVPKLLPSYAGLLVEEEVRELTKALQPDGKSLAIIGGAKFNTKEIVLNKLLNTYDNIFVGGALANDFLKASGREVGKSLVSGNENTGIKEILNNKKIILPIDVVVINANTINTNTENARAYGARIASINDIKTDEIIVDAGPETNALLDKLTKESDTILWNGPLGKYENGFIEGTNALSRSIAQSQARSVVGGGDTVASINSLGLAPRFSFVSTGGGAMLNFLANGTLPGIEVLR